MSRPKGSLNRNSKPVGKIKHRKRGRPRKEEVKVKEPELPIPKSVKFYGYCPKCEMSIIKNDLTSKFIYVCPGCGKKGRISGLKKVRKNSEKPKSKKEYLESTIHHQHIAHSEEDIDPDKLKVQE